MDAKMGGAKDENTSNILVITGIGDGRLGLIKYVAWLTASILFYYVMLIFLVDVVKAPLWAKGLCAVGYTIFILNALTIRTSILNKDNNTVTIIMRLFGFLTIYKRVTKLSDFYGIRVRMSPPTNRINNESLIFELVGTQGTTLRLKYYRYSNESSRKEVRLLRDSIAAWANKRVLFDQFFPIEEPSV